MRAASVPPVLLRAALERASALTRTPLLLCEGACSQASAFVARHLQASPGQRCLVVTPPTSSRAAPLLHYLRRGGFYPLTVELPDGAPNAAHASAAIGAARRTGVSFVVGVGSSSTLSVARAVAALLPNGGNVVDYAAGLGGAAELRQPSLPLLSVPTCPSGLELSREALLLVEGHALAGLRAHPESLQAALVDPALATTLAGEPALTTAWSALAHALEAYTRPDSSRAGRELAWMALELAARALLPALAPRLPGAAAPAADGLSPAAALAAASALVSASLAEGPLGPCRGVALSIASRYAIPYATALLAVTPRVFSEPAARTMGAYEEIAREMAARVADQAAQRQQEQQQQQEGQEQWNWESKDGSRGAGSAPAPRRRSASGGAMPKPRGQGVAPSASGSRAAPPGKGARRVPSEAEAAAAQEEARREAAEEEELLRLAREASGEGLEGLEDAPPAPLPTAYSVEEEVPLADGEEDSELIRSARRYAHVAALLQDVRGEAKGGSGGGMEGGALLVPWEPLAAVEARVRLNAQGRELGLGLEGALRALAAEGARCVALKSGAPTLEDYGLTDADLAAIAEMAEVDANTLTALLALKKSDIVEMLQES